MTNSIAISAYAWSWHPAHLNLNLHQLLAQINQCKEQCLNSGTRFIYCLVPVYLLKSMKIVSVNVSIPREVLLSGQIVTTGMQLIYRNTNNIIVKDIIRLYTRDDKNIEMIQ